MTFSGTHLIPGTQDDLIRGIRHFLADTQGLIRAETGDDYVYAIVKDLQQPSGVQYVLTYQKFCGDFILQIQGFYEEIGQTGVRDNMVAILCMQKGIVGNEDDIFAGWSRDPYDDTITTGALMNQSEEEEYDEMFSGFPLSMCREFIDCVLEG